MAAGTATFFPSAPLLLPALFGDPKAFADIMTAYCFALRSAFQFRPSMWDSCQISHRQNSFVTVVIVNQISLPSPSVSAGEDFVGSRNI